MLNQIVFVFEGDRSLAAISLHLKGLKKLVLSRCRGFTDVGIQFLITPPIGETENTYFQSRPLRLNSVDTSFSDNISDAARRLLACSGCRVLSTGSSSTGLG